jgi:hypothetical protein
MCAARRNLAAFGDKSVVPDQILSSEVRSLIAAHVRVGCRTGPITLQRSKSLSACPHLVEDLGINIQGDTNVG